MKFSLFFQEVKKRNRRYVGGCLTSAPDLPIPGVSPLIADGRLLSISERTVKTMERALFLAKVGILDCCPLLGIQY